MSFLFFFALLFGVNVAAKKIKICQGKIWSDKKGLAKKGMVKNYEKFRRVAIKGVARNFEIFWA